MSRAEQSPLWPGVAMALASAVLFGIATPLSKLLLDTIDPQMLAGLLYLGAGVGLACVRLTRSAMGIAALEAPLRIADLPLLLTVVLFGGVAGPLLLMLGLARTDAASTSLLLNVEGLATMGIAWVLFRENVDRRLILGAACIVAGAVLLSWTGFGTGLHGGMVWIVGACLAWGIDNNLTRKLSAADPVLIAMIKGLVAGSVNTGIVLLNGSLGPPMGTIAAAAVVGFLGVGVSLVLFVRALRHLGTARTGAYFSLAPFIGAVVAVLLLREPLTMKLIGSGLLMGCGLWLHLTERHGHEHQHEMLEHEHRHEHDKHHRHEHEFPVVEPHSHWHRHTPLRHSHPHYPDLHHRHLHL